MNARSLALVRVCLGLVGAFVAQAGALAAPDWALRLAALPTPTCAANASAVVLLDETSVTLQEEGVADVTHRIAIRILASNGSDWAAASVAYLQNGDQVRTTDSWLIRKGDHVRDRDRDAWLDVSTDSFGTLYGEYRSKLNRRSDAVAGDVYVAETRVTGQLLESVLTHRWGWKIPVAEQTYRLTLPTGFRTKPFAVGENPPVAISTPDGRTQIWSVRDRPLKLAEPLSPFDEVDGLLEIQIEPSATATRYKPIVLHSWADVSRWLSTLGTGQCDSSPALHDMVLRLTKDCATTTEKIAALGRYVQKLPYVARNEGLGKGLGYQPHKASQVFGMGYGDCKDKSNLLCAMLREIGVEAFIASARIGDDWDVSPEFPSPAQFDHAIAAIRVDSAQKFPACVETSQWGSLLFFDATDPFTSPGDLPARLQGTRVQVQSVGSDSLIQLPRIPPQDGHVLARKAELNLERGGGIKGHVSIEGHGQAATKLRVRFANAPTDEALRKSAAELLGDPIRSAQLSNLQKKDPLDLPLCGVSFDLAKTTYTQHLPNGSMVASFDVLGRGMLPSLSAPDRRTPILLRPIAFNDEVALTLPDGVVSEELPAALSLSSDFGSYERKIVVDGNKITLVRHAELKPQVVPAADYAKLRKFLADFAKADRTSILLRKS